MIIYRTPTLLDVEAVADIQDRLRTTLSVYYPKIPIKTVTNVINAANNNPKEVFVLIVDKISNNNNNRNIIFSYLSSFSSSVVERDETGYGLVNNTFSPSSQVKFVPPLPICSQVGFISCLTHDYYGILIAELDAIYVDKTLVNSFELISIFRGLIRRANIWSKNIGAYRIVYTNNSGDSKMLDKLLEKEGANRIGSSMEFKNG